MNLTLKNPWDGVSEPGIPTIKGQLNRGNEGWADIRYGGGMRFATK